jgi:CheY-like chemotaxis protein
MNTAPRIAVVDDELIVAKDLESTLRSFGYDVPGTAPTGQEAITLANTHKPDLMLMDIRLRGELDGIETARHIQQQFDVPIVFVTAFADEETLSRARETCPYGYLVKPVQDNALRSTVTTALNRHRAERQTRTSLKRQRALFDALGHLLWTAREDGRADYFNQRWFETTGLTHSASRGFGWVTALQPTDMHQCLSIWKEAVVRKTGFELVCSVMVAKTKRYRRHLLRVVPLPDTPGGLQWLATLTDIHDFEARSDVSRFAESGTLTAPTASAAATASTASDPAEPTARAEHPAQAKPAAAQAIQTAMDNAKPKPQETFRDGFCAASLCTPDEFADRVFLLSLYFHALPLAVLLWPWRTSIFAKDFALIEHVANAQWHGDVQWQLDRLRTPQWFGGLSRRFLRCRISTQRLGALMSKVLDGSSGP